jgi:ATP-dependent DNA ligase
VNKLAAPLSFRSSAQHADGEPRVLPWRTPDVFDDGEALLEATSTLGLEGVVAKKRSEPYKPGERGWVKTKHRTYWRFGQELESAQRQRRVRLTF